MSAPNKPVALKELDIPGRTGPVSNNPIIWGINIAAAQGNFPLHGLLCRAGPWGNMAIGDTLRISWGSWQNVWVETVDKTEVNTQLQMFVPLEHMVDGRFAVSYVVKPLGGTDQPSDVMQVLVKLTRPGGDSPLIMIIPQAILDGGIDKDNVADGVPITIGKADGTPPYSNAAAGDVCRVSWGGIYVFSDPLTQEQAEGKAPIIITIIEAVIREAGDADFPGVAVVFDVFDKVFNRSEDWSAEQRVVVAVDATRLVAPLLKETQNNELDVDKLADADGTVQVIATDTSKFKVGDEVFIRIKGTPVEGPPIDWEPSAGVKLESVPSVMETTAPNAVLRQLAKSQITLSYRLEKADGSADLRSKSQFIRAIGEVQRLAAPKVLDENSGALDPALDKIRLEIRFDKSFAEGQALKIFMLGTTPGLEPYLPDLALRPITHNEIVAGLPLAYSIDGKHLATVNGGTVEFYYQQWLPDSVLATLDLFEATHAIRESIHTDILRVGEPRLELPEPEVAGVVNGVLPADTAGTTATVTYTKTVKNDEAFMFWKGSKTGEYTDSIKLNEFTAGQRVPFPIPAAVIKGNEGGTVEARYHIVRAAGGTSYSDTLTFSVGVALENPLPLPQMPQTTGNGASVTLAPLDAQTGARVVVTFTGMNETHSIKLVMTGTPGAGSPDIPAKPGVISGGVEFLIPAEAIAANIGNTAQTFTLEYEVTTGTGEIPSETLTVTVTPLPAAELDKLNIVEAEGDELDLSKVTAGATFRAGVWAFIKSGQPVWAELKGKTAQGAAHNRAIWTVPGSSVNQTWINAGKFDRAVPFSYLKVLGHDTYLEIVFKVALTLSQVEEEAIAGPVKRYRVKAVEDVVPIIDSVKGSSSNEDIPAGDQTVETAIILSGTATPDTKIDLANNGTLMPNTEIEVDSKGEWTFILTALIAGTTYSLSARRKDGTLSNTWNIVVVASVVPTLDSVQDDKGIEVPDRQFTVSTQLKLKGTASYGQKVEIFDGDEASAVSKGIAPVDDKGEWNREIEVAVQELAHRLYAKSLYHSGSVYSNVRFVTVIEDIAPTIVSVKGTISGEDITEGGDTVETAVTLSGRAAKGQNIEVFDGTEFRGKASVDMASGIWTKEVADLPVGLRKFKANALYGSQLESDSYSFNVFQGEMIEDFEKTPIQSISLNQSIETPFMKITLIEDTQNAQMGIQEVSFFIGHEVDGHAIRTPLSGKFRIKLKATCKEVSFYHRSLDLPGIDNTVTAFSEDDIFLTRVELSKSSDRPTYAVISATGINQLEFSTTERFYLDAFHLTP
ncbi:hypothetical protein [Pseudomonas sp. SCA2728.1_7]|uniref:hypothetical protein n=1 Tax=Pseudomonas sp. SCA2728.1_7 TaxID=2825975 RepID=UPI001BB007B6|nr:hypothetical protein [Pseudomonas sp. SCA2728.1_7]QUE91288.1 hypothetical protein KBP52_02250 [Pseudomonas sp. SCA2728.1_7]